MRSTDTWPVRLGAEAAGTAILVFAVAGAAIFNASFDSGTGDLNGGFVAVALALGFSVLIGSYAFGRFSGGHFNPAVTVGAAIAGRFDWRRVAGYVAAQIIGGIVGASAIWLIAAGAPDGFAASAQKSGFASTGWGPLSPGGFDLASAFIVEVLATAILVTVVLCVNDRAHGGIAIGLTLTLVAIVAIPVSNGSFNPARSIATAVYGGPVALEQLWMSVVAPLLGAFIAGAVAAGVARSRRRIRRTENAPVPPSAAVIG
ncbi:aquaporin [Microbacterium sp. CIAB417]|uniref:aquaporin n=1 Tax=Microbacterium sp. CIAB417 TaxID=2860287 RepID=UPI001FAD5911|nr:aquaporin [Microbacterium sp. CIAB417]